MQTPAAPASPINAQDVFKKLLQQGQTAMAPAAQPEQPSLMSRLMSQQGQQQAAQAFDASKFYALLRGRR